MICIDLFSNSPSSVEAVVIYKKRKKEHAGTLFWSVTGWLWKMTRILAASRACFPRVSETLRSSKKESMAVSALFFPTAVSKFPLECYSYNQVKKIT